MNTEPHLMFFHVFVIAADHQLRYKGAAHNRKSIGDFIIIQ